MKKLVLSFVVIAFAVAAQAGGTTGCCGDKEQTACCKGKETMQTSASKCGAKTACTKQTSAKQALLSPKAKSLA